MTDAVAAPAATAAPAGAAAPAAAPAAAAAAPAASPAAAAGTPTDLPAVKPSAASPGAAPAAVPARPDHVEEKFWDAKTGTVRVDDVLKSYKEATSKLSTRSDDLLREAQAARAASIPKTAAEYKAELPADWKSETVPDYKLHADSPIIAALRDSAHANGLTQEQFSKQLATIADAQIKLIPAKDAWMKPLGDNAKDRVERVTLWANGKLGRDATSVNPLLAGGAKAVEALEKLMAATGEPALASGGGTAAPAATTLPELRKMQADPRYSDPMRRDPAFVAKVDAGFRTLYPAQLSTASMGPAGRA